MAGPERGKSVLIVGIDSQVGAETKTHLEDQGLAVFGTTRRRQSGDGQSYYLDLENPDFAVFDRRFDAAVICAATTSLAECEADPEKYRAINVTNTVQLIDQLVGNGSFVVYLSSNAVFDGERPFSKHTDAPCPTTAYGQFKAEVEEHIRRNCPDRAAILRLTKVITKNTPFIERWKTQASQGTNVETYGDVLISPIDIDAVVDAIGLLIAQNKSGVYQLGGERELSYTDYARQVFKDAPQVLELIAEVAKPAERVRHNSLSTHLPTKEAQYNEILEAERPAMGLMSGHAYLGDTKRLAFTLSRYKFVSKMFSGFGRVLEVGCADAFGTPIVRNEVDSLTACDFDYMFIDDARRTHPFRDRIEFRVHDMIKGPLEAAFDGAFSLDVLEHIDKRVEDDFMRNICLSLTDSGSCIIGMPSLESQVYASEISKQGHVNCKKGPELKSFLSRYFERVFMFSMNDEVVHTGYQPMAQYLIALCCHPLRREHP